MAPIIHSPKPPRMDPPGEATHAFCGSYAENGRGHRDRCAFPGRVPEPDGGYGTSASPQGPAPTSIRVTISSVSVSSTVTSFEGPFAV